MEAEKFDHIVKGRFEGFESSPPESVWNNIDAHLGERKRRFGLLWWLLPLLVIAGSLGTWYFIPKAANTSSETTMITAYADTPAKKEHKTPTYTAEQQTKNTTSENEAKPISTNHSGTIKEPKTASVNPPKTPSMQRPSQTIGTQEEPREESTSKSNKTLRGDTLQFTAMKPLGLFSQPQIPQLQTCAAYAGMPPIKQYIGLRLSSFVPLSQPRLQQAENDTEPTTAMWSSQTEQTLYNRPWEAELYYQRMFWGGYSAISGNAAIAQHNSRYTDSSDETYYERGTSIGAGAGFDFFFDWDRFSLQAFANARWEMQFNSMEGTNVFESGSTTDPTALPGMNTSYKFRRHAVSLEGGLQANYHLNMHWTLFGQVAYRNYIWEQNAPITQVVNAPQFLRIGAGIQWKIPSAY